QNGVGWAQTNIFDNTNHVWLPSGDTTMLNPGSGAFIHNAGQSELLIRLIGNVPQGLLENSLPAGKSLVSSFTPQSGGLDSVIGFSPTPGDIAQRYHNSDGGGYT